MVGFEVTPEAWSGRKVAAQKQIHYITVFREYAREALFEPAGSIASGTFHELQSTAYAITSTIRHNRARSSLGRKCECRPCDLVPSRRAHTGYRLAAHGRLDYGVDHLRCRLRQRQRLANYPGALSRSSPTAKSHVNAGEFDSAA